MARGRRLWQAGVDGADGGEPGAPVDNLTYRQEYLVVTKTPPPVVRTLATK